MNNQEDDCNFEMRYDHLYKVGDISVGKSSLLAKYVKGVFPTSPLPTIAIEFATKIIQLREGGYVKAQLWDTAGNEKYKSITSYHYRKAVGALLVYDITIKDSFLNAQRWLTELKQYAEPDCVIMLVGNKLDLVLSNRNKRQVSYDEAKAFAEANELKFMESSAFSNFKVSECFEDLIQEIYNERRKVNNKYRQNANNFKINAANNKNKRGDKGCFEC